MTTEYLWTDDSQQAVIRVDDIGNVIAYFPGDDGYDDAASQASSIADTITKRPPANPDNVRAERDRLLAASDWTQVSDAPVDQAAWATYRQALRDVPQQAGFPDNITWPEVPA